ncbi:DUF4418 family protein [Gleimia hominis]|uniref:DUF4418 family protein n=1 Tax=Gleimia hominis TaxID=595468 RepID=A0ABU3I7Z6_9ACTO|nr:DUF4418 family protein [Gleimia hominis]MDT3766504.1 DUF4418 family protein [Gleimia hominis]
MRNKIIASAPAIIFGLLIAIAPQTFATPCPVAGMPMACHWTAQASLGIGVVIALMGTFALMAPPAMRAGISIGVVLTSALELAVVTVLIGVCDDPMMHCHSVMKPTLIVVSVLAMVCGGIAFALDQRGTSTGTHRTANPSSQQSVNPSNHRDR